MKIRYRVLCLLSVLAGLAACSMHEAGTGPGPFPSCNSLGNSSDCEIPVNVQAKPDGCELKLAQGHETIEFKDKRSNRNRVIHWRLTGIPDYVFAANGIDFVDDPDGNFMDRMASPDRREFRATNQNLESKRSEMSYKYDIVVERTGGAQPGCHLDPFIRNLRS